MEDKSSSNASPSPLDATRHSSDEAPAPSAAFTPGPWRHLLDHNGRHEVRSGGLHTVAAVFHTPDGLADRNADLITAAPDQNAALVALLARFTRFLASDRNQADAYNFLVKGAFADWTAASDAIAKAEGCQP